MCLRGKIGNSYRGRFVIRISNFLPEILPWLEAIEILSRREGEEKKGGSGQIGAAAADLGELETGSQRMLRLRRAGAETWFATVVGGDGGSSEVRRPWARGSGESSAAWLTEEAAVHRIWANREQRRDGASFPEVCGRREWARLNVDPLDGGLTGGASQRWI